MKIEAGKFYRTKGGLKAKVYETGVSLDANNQGVIFGSLESRSTAKTLFPMMWDSKGVSGNGAYTIVAEWKEKPKVNFNKLKEIYPWAAMDKNGEWFLFAKEPKADSREECWYNDEEIGFDISNEIFEYSGDWKDSLIKF